MHLKLQCYRLEFISTRRHILNKRTSELYVSMCYAVHHGTFASLRNETRQRGKQKFYVTRTVHPFHRRIRPTLKFTKWRLRLKTNGEIETVKINIHRHT